MLWSSLVVQCHQNEEPQTTLTFLNHSNSAQYVGIETCKSCHYDIYQSYIETGMGKSFAHATRAKSALPNNPPLLTDEFTNFHYLPFFKKDSLFLNEFKWEFGDTSHQLIKKVDFIIGSGQHTNSHLWQTNGYHFQMPFTWYTQNQRIDLPPGFENGHNSRFSRPIGLECMSCHNAMPLGFKMGSENKLENLPQGIDCERCHGPGSFHVKKIQSGDITDTSKYADLSIVNPKKLSPELQFEICQRCHLQGNAVLKSGKSFFDFKPGMYVHEVMDVYMPRPDGDNEQFIMAGHVQRFKMSKCFIKGSGSFVCTSCHNPHVSVKKTNSISFNQKCISCHSNNEKGCTEEKSLIISQKNNCVKCHMPIEGSSDIPHVSVHDHYIRIPSQKALVPASGKMGLYAVNHPNPSKLSRLLAYLQQYERFESNILHLDSASRHLNITEDEGMEGVMALVHYYFLRVNYNAIAHLVIKNGLVPENLAEPAFDNRFAWTAYRIATAYRNLHKNADSYYQASIAAAPFILEIKLAYASYKLEKGDHPLARVLYEEVIHEHNELEEAFNAIGYIDMLEGKWDKAYQNLKRSLALNPNYELALLNMGIWHYENGQKKESELYVKNCLAINAKNQKALSLLKMIQAD